LRKQLFSKNKKGTEWMLNFSFVVEQGSANWRKLRIGIPTASRFDKIITPGGKMVEGRDRKDYIYRLVAERILGEPMPERFQGNEWTDRGEIMESEALGVLARRLGVVLSAGGFVKSRDDRCGCSPDAIVVGGNEACEIKCPGAWSHIGYMVDGVGTAYKPQVQGQLLIGGWDAVHFFSYHPKFSPVHITTRVDEIYREKMVKYLDIFCCELDATESWVRKHGDVNAFLTEAMNAGA
jgi:hypothetical protein